MQGFFRDNPALVPFDESPVVHAQRTLAPHDDPDRSPIDGDVSLAHPAPGVTVPVRKQGTLPPPGCKGAIELQSQATSSALPSPRPETDPENGERVADRRAAAKSSDPGDEHLETPEDEYSGGSSAGTGDTSTVAAASPLPNNAKYRPEVYENGLDSLNDWVKLTRARLLHFSPSWFVVTMGTGMLGNLLLMAPWPNVHAVLRWPGTVLVIFNAIVFLLFTTMILVRYTIFPSVLRLTLTHSQQSLFLGTPAMSLTTVFSGLLAVGQAFNVQGLGDFTTENYPSVGVSIVAAVGWFFTMLVSVTVAIGIPWSMMTWQTHTLRQTTALLLLPIVPPITVGNAGGSFADVIRSSAEGHRPFAPVIANRLHSLAWVITIWSYALLGIGVLLALFILVLYFQRLVLFKAPPREIILSVMLPLGPCGQGADGLIHAGAAAAALLPAGTSAMNQQMGVALHAAGLMVGLLLWALGIWWFAIAILTIARERYRGHFPFNMGWWSMTFPYGSLIMATERIALTLDSNALHIVFAVLVGFNACLWATCMIPTLRGFLSGELLIAPCISKAGLRP